MGTSVAGRGWSPISTTSAAALFEALQLLDDLGVEAGDSLGELVEGVGLLRQEVGAGPQEAGLSVEEAGGYPTFGTQHSSLKRTE